jgi:hypothetical protein
MQIAGILQEHEAGEGRETGSGTRAPLHIGASRCSKWVETKGGFEIRVQDVVGRYRSLLRPTIAKPRGEQQGSADVHYLL